MKKMISPTIKSANQNKLFFNLSVKDLIFTLYVFLGSLVLWVPWLFVKGLMIVGIVIFTITMFLIFLLLIELDKDLRLYKWIQLYFLFIIRKKNKVLDEKIDKVEENRIFLKNKNKITILRIIGEDTNFIDDDNFENLSIVLDKFLKNKNYFFYKMDGNINLDLYKNDILKKMEKIKNENIMEELKKNLKIINDFNSDLMTSTQNKYYIGIINSNIVDKSDVNGANNILIKSNIKLEIPSKQEFDEFLNNSFFIKNEIVEHSNYIKSIDTENNTLFNRFLEIKGAPFEVYREWLSLFFNQQGISIYLRVNDWKEKNVEKKINNILANSEFKLNSISFHNKFRQEQLERVVETFTNLVSQLGKEDELKKVSMIIKVEGKSKEEMNFNYKEIISNINRYNFKFDKMMFKQIESFQKFIPDGNDIEEKSNYIDVLSSVLSFGSPFNTLELLHSNSSILARDKNNTPLSINFKLRNELISSSSMVILGKTGSGKTTTTKRIIKNNIIDGGFKIFCIDPENEYGSLIEEFGGVIIDNTNPKNLINPFEIKENKEISFDIAKQEKINSVSIFMKMLFSDVMNPNEISILVHIINEMYSKFKYKEFTFSDVYKVLAKDKEVKKYENILIQFRNYCKSQKGTSSMYWDNKSQLNLENDYICFQYRNLLNLPDKLAFALIYNTFEYINSIVMSNMNSNKYISIFIDEAHLLLNDKHIDVVKRVVEMYKRIRKYHGMITIITQNITDLYKSSIKEYTSTIMNNSQYLMIHTIKPTEIPELEQLLKEDGGLSDEEKEFLRYGISGDCILMFGKKRTQIKVIQ